MNIIELNFSKPTKSVPNFGIELLKSTLYFFILVYHCYDQNLSENKILKIILDAIPLYYPALCLIFFYFSYSHLTNKNLIQIQKRFLKLIVPYIIWPSIFYLINYLSTDRRTIKYTFKDLLIQIIIGRGIACVFWFPFNLIIINIIFCLVIFSTKHYRMHILFIILFISYISEYLGIIEILMENYSDNIKRSVGRLFRMTSYSIIGFSFASLKILPIIKNKRIICLCVSFLFIFLVFFFKLYNSMTHFYEGIFINIGIISIFIFFYMLPFEHITFGPLIFLIKQITSYSSGIYYIHIKISDYFKDSFHAFEEKTLVGCALNYIISYFICFIGMKMFGRTILKYLFIR